MRTRKIAALTLFGGLIFADVAQLVEHRIRNAGVGGSNPFVGTIHQKLGYRPISRGASPYCDVLFLSAAVHSTEKDCSMATIRVTDSASLTAALAAATAGDTISLAAGNYGVVNLAQRSFSSAITITSENPAQLAHIDRVNFQNVSGVNFKALDIGIGLAPGEPDYSKVISLNSVQRITIDGVRLHGSLDSDPKNDGFGVTIRSSSDIVIKNSTLEQFSSAISSYQVTGLQVLNNEFHDLRIDGVISVGVSNVVIDGNKFHDFDSVAGDHADAIQFGSYGLTTIASNIRVTNNVTWQGKGDGFQSIFFNDETGVLPYTDVVIENNVATVNDGYNGLAVLGGKNVTIRNNTIVSQNGTGEGYWIRLERVNGATFSGNKTNFLIDVNNTRVAASGNTIDRRLFGNLATTQAPVVPVVPVAPPAAPAPIAKPAPVVPPIALPVAEPVAAPVVVPVSTPAPTPVVVVAPRRNARGVRNVVGSVLSSSGLEGVDNTPVNVAPVSVAPVVAPVAVKPVVAAAPAVAAPVAVTVAPKQPIILQPAAPVAATPVVPSSAPVAVIPLPTVAATTPATTFGTPFTASKPTLGTIALLTRNSARNSLGDSFFGR